MTVQLTVSKVLNPPDQVDDALSGGGVGIDLGSTVNGEYTPITNKAANTGWLSLYVSHDAAIDPITDVGTFIQQYSQAYGGADDAPGDFATMQSKGAASGNSANNADGLSGGLRIEHDADIAGTLGLSAFDGTRAQVKIYGAGAAGVSLATAYAIHVDALIFNDSGTPVDATTPVTGKIGKAGDTVLGDTAWIKLRYYLETAALDGGVIQCDYVFKYSFTA